MENQLKIKIRKIIAAVIVIFLGLILFKYIPMQIYGDDILFDASRHVVTTIFGLYILWFFIDQNKKWHLPFFIFSASAVIIISIQRILAKQHNEIGVFLGIVIGIAGISFAEWEKIKNKIKF